MCNKENEKKDPTLCDCICHKRPGVMHMMACCEPCPDCQAMISADKLRPIDGMSYLNYHKKYHCKGKK